MVGWLVRMVERRRGLAWAVVGVISVGALAGLPRLVFDDDPVALFRSDDEAWTVLEQLKKDFETGSDDLLVVLQSEPLFRPEVVAGEADGSTAARYDRRVEPGVHAYQ